MTIGEHHEVPGIKEIKIGGEAARVRANEIVERAQLNEAVKVLTELMDEVAAMRISDGFKTDKIPSESEWAKNASLNPNFRGLNEQEYKRQTLLSSLQRMRQDIALSVSRLQELVVDIEATKAVDSSESSKATE